MNLKIMYLYVLSSLLTYYLEEHGNFVVVINSYVLVIKGRHRGGSSEGV